MIIFEVIKVVHGTSFTILAALLVAVRKESPRRLTFCLQWKLCHRLSRLMEMPPSLPTNDVILPHTIAIVTISGEKPILALTLQVLFATATTASSLLLTFPYNPSNIALFSLFVVTVLQIRFSIFMKF